MIEPPPGDYAIGSDHWPGTSKLIEELGELQQVLGKLLGTGGSTKHWDGSDLRKRLVEEIGDVQGAIDFFAEENLTVSEGRAILQRQKDKRRVFDQWHNDQKLGGRS